jgi:hypothetical protein
MSQTFNNNKNVMVGMLECNGWHACLECGRSGILSPGQVKPKSMKLVFVDVPLGTQY